MRMVILFSLLLASSCATRYQSKGYAGGYSEQKVAKDIFIVTFSGNGYTRSTAVQSYLLKRCAELTLLNGFTHFVTVDQSGHTDTSYQLNQPGSANGSIDTINKHSKVATIKMIKDPPEGIIAYDAQVIFGPVIKRATSSVP